MTSLLIINKILSILTVFSQGFLLIALLYLIFSRFKVAGLLFQFLAKWALPLGFPVALIATLGSLFYSEVAGYPPCELCWYQRIFMYSQVFLIALAWIKKDRNIFPYVLLLSTVGLLIAAYHNYLYFGNSALAACTVGAGSVACLASYVLEFNYVTIPIMSLSAFSLLVLIFASAYFLKKEELITENKDNLK